MGHTAIWRWWLKGWGWKASEGVEDALVVLSATGRGQHVRWTSRRTTQHAIHFENVITKRERHDKNGGFPEVAFPSREKFYRTGKFLDSRASRSRHFGASASCWILTRGSLISRKISHGTKSNNPTYTFASTWTESEPRMLNTQIAK